MKQTRKGKQYYFGIRAHIGADVVTGLTHSVATTSADVTIAGQFVRDCDKQVYGDAGYRAWPGSSGCKKTACNGLGAWQTMDTEAARSRP